MHTNLHRCFKNRRGDWEGRRVRSKLTKGDRRVENKHSSWALNSRWTFCQGLVVDSAVLEKEVWLTGILFPADCVHVPMWVRFLFSLVISKCLCIFQFYVWFQGCGSNHSKKQCTLSDSFDVPPLKKVLKPTELDLKKRVFSEKWRNDVSWLETNTECTGMWCKLCVLTQTLQAKRASTTPVQETSATKFLKKHKRSTLKVNLLLFCGL